jgi:hypothetical protein
MPASLPPKKSPIVATFAGICPVPVGPNEPVRANKITRAALKRLSDTLGGLQQSSPDQAQPHHTEAEEDVS